MTYFDIITVNKMIKIQDRGMGPHHIYALVYIASL